MSKIRVGAISLDCGEPGPLTTFWADLLGGEIVVMSHDIGVVKLDHLFVTAMRVEGYVPPTWPMASVPKQGHIDLEVEDLDEAAGRAVALGAVRAGAQPEPESHLVLLDPAGHPFCLSLSANFPP